MNEINDLLKNIDSGTIRGSDENTISAMNRDNGLNIHRKKETVDYNTNYSVGNSNYNQNNDRINDLKNADLYNNITSLKMFENDPKFTKHLKKDNEKNTSKMNITNKANSKMHELMFNPNSHPNKISKNNKVSSNKSSKIFYNPIKKFDPISDQTKYNQHFDKKIDHNFKNETIDSKQHKNNSLMEHYVRTPNITFNKNQSLESGGVQKINYNKQDNYKESQKRYQDFTFSPSVSIPNNFNKLSDSHKKVQSNFVNHIEPNFSLQSPNNKDSYNSLKSNNKSYNNLKSNKDSYNSLKSNFQPLNNQALNNKSSNNKFVNRIEPNFSALNSYIPEKKNNSKINQYNNTNFSPNNPLYSKSLKSNDFNNKFQSFTPLANTMSYNINSNDYPSNINNFYKNTKNSKREDDNKRFQNYTPIANARAYDLNKEDFSENMQNFYENTKKSKDDAEHTYKKYAPLPSTLNSNPTLNSDIKLNTKQLLPMDTRNQYNFNNNPE